MLYKGRSCELTVDSEEGFLVRVDIIWPKLDHPCDGAPSRLKTNKLLQMLKFCQMGSCHGQGLLMLMLVNGDGDGDGDVKMVNDPGVPNARWRELPWSRSRVGRRRQNRVSQVVQLPAGGPLETKTKRLQRQRQRQKCFTTCVAIKACVSGIPYLNQV